MTDKSLPEKLDKWAKEQAISYTLSYWEASDEYEIETISPAYSECFYVKHVWHFEDFKERFEESKRDKQSKGY
jgi:hypothetical protein